MRMISARRIQSLLEAVNAKTGYIHLDLNSAVQTLLDGYRGTVGEYSPQEPGTDNIESVNNLRRLLYRIEQITKRKYGDLTEAVQALIDDYGTVAPLYSFGAMSDIHLQYATGVEDFQRALAYFDYHGMPFNCICGDLTWAGRMVNVEKYREYRQSIGNPITWVGGLDDYKTLKGNRRIYECGGNHETYTSYYEPTEADPARWVVKEYTLDVDYWKETTGNDTFFTVSSLPTDANTRNVNDPTLPSTDVFIMLSIYQASAPHLWLDGEFEWLQSTLEANEDKRCFVFFHEHDNDDKVADPFGLYPSGITSKSGQGKQFIDLMKNYKNCIWFHGHTHTTFMEDHPPVGTSFARGYKSVNIPSLQGPRKWLPETGGFTTTGYNSEAYRIDVYKNHIVLKCLDMDTVNQDGTGRATVLETYAIDTPM